MDAVVDFGGAVSDAELDEAIARVKADDLATIVYTSGSTGRPKGAMLSHRNFTHIVYAGYDVLDEMLFQPSRLLLFLPLAHCFARYIQYVAIGANGVVGYIPNADHLLADLRGFKPTYLLGVPRVFEKVYNAASQKAGRVSADGSSPRPWPISPSGPRTRWPAGRIPWPNGCSMRSI